MSLVDVLPETLRDGIAFLRAELAPFPGRVNVMLRALLTSAIVIVMSLTLEVPELPLSLLVVFYVTQSNVVITRLVGLMFIIGSTIAIGSSILLLKFTFDYPLVRIVVASALFFGSVYLMRVLKIGIVFFIVAIVIIYVQTFVDQTDQAELLIRAVLWVWVAVNYPIALTLVINSLLLPAEPQRQLKAEFERQLTAVDTRLTQLIDGGPVPAPITTTQVQQGALTLQKLLKFATMRDSRYRDTQAWHLASIATVTRLHLGASQLVAGEQRSSLYALRENCRALATALANDAPYSIERAPTPDIADAVGRADTVIEMQRALSALSDFGARGEPAASPPVKEPMIVLDAWTNPAYARFSLKTLLAVLISYVFYNASDWQGIHTIMLTCLIVALPSLGASTQRALLRVAGALGGSTLALLVVVFVIPRLDSIAGLLLMALPIAALAAWIAAGSERIGYAGVQLLFTFSLAVLGQFGPTTNLTEIRDRMVGILLGVGIATFIQMSFWREAEGDVLRLKLASMLRPVAALLRVAPGHVGASGQLSYAQQQLQTWAVLGDCEAMLARVALEPNWQEGEQAHLTMRAQVVLAQGREIMLAGDALHKALDAYDARATGETVDTVRAIQERAAARIDRYASELSSSPPTARQPRRIEIVARADGLPDAPLWASLRRLAGEVAGLPDWELAAPHPGVLREFSEHD
ncbi:multidrug efflux system protein MdtO [Caballeronia sordidicola]|uniref:Multidrug efflux system protein MdtO n=1 Tax=Caballeronia sordidicola TaxID=196367 RepID=A0A158G0U8_CABSO|nr:FUSC family protein [Caballeronia sordidicola]SAL25040.1 multidrug efflux system protein MdtO [Caballeronia sordidicola]